MHKATGFYMFIYMTKWVLLFVYFRAWPKRVEVAKENPEERAKLIETCSLSEPDKEVIRREVRCKKYTGTPK